MKDKIIIKEIIPVGVYETGFIISKDKKGIYVSSDIDIKTHKIKKNEIKSARLDILHFNEDSLEKIKQEKKEIEQEGEFTTYSIKGKIIKIEANHVAIDCGFLLNTTLDKKQLSEIKEGDYVSLEGVRISAYDIK